MDLLARLFSVELGNWSYNDNVESISSDPSAILCPILVSHPGQMQKSLTSMIRENGSIKREKTVICYLPTKLRKKNIFFFPLEIGKE